ncbi:NAD-dependent protein deacetylase sirtuin-2 [Coemansia spiralis]|uniref:NAD-dependent protein deacetylase sirtuin-2 n=1 Tax=Coemansia spiralis TaxID=417178 RepID=A0A9W8GJ30_9FUNG|nr:NAD-dependent protein deacetylase sirtuin-2 [Coemansia spiralis]
MDQGEVIADLAQLLGESLTLDEARVSASVSKETAAKVHDAHVAPTKDGPIANMETKDASRDADCDGLYADNAAAAVVPPSPGSDEVSDSEDSYAGSSSGSDSDDDLAWSGPPPPLQVYSPLLPAGATSLFAASDSLLEAIADMVVTGKAKNVIVMAGAGISTDAGIPDFRSPGTGLYDNLQKFNLPHPEAIFSIDYFRRNPKPFYVLAKELYPGQYVPTQSHFFVKLLEQKGLLLRHYTQNIDCLERAAGIDPELIVEAHGSFHTAHCIGRKCRQEYSQAWVKEHIFRDEIPRCSSCDSLVKPDITFFGEGLPSRFFELLVEDFAKCDLLIVMGTSLLVQPFASIIDHVGPHVPRLLINRMRVGESKAPGAGFDFDGRFGKSLHRDAFVAGDSDEACALFAGHLGWLDELVELRASHIAKQGLDLAK